MVEKPPSNVEYYNNSDNIPFSDKIVEEFDIDAGLRPHIRIKKFVGLNDKKERIYVQVVSDVEKFKPKDETRCPSIKDAVNLSYSLSKEYDIPVLLDNIDFGE